MLELLGKKLHSPLFVPSGIIGVDEVLGERIDLNGFGFVVLKTITLRPRIGNKGIRVYDIPCGMMNSIGLPNEGLEAFVKEAMPKLKDFPIDYIVSITVHSEDELDAFGRLSDIIPWAIEVNLSCPNIEHSARGLISQDTDMSYRIIKKAKSVLGVPIIAKLSPDVAFIGDIAQAVVSAGADAVSVSNTFQGIAIDLSLRRPVFDRISAGVSGPAIFNLALKRVWDCFEEIDVPILGIGGVHSSETALQMAACGAMAVGVGSYLYHDPYAGERILRGIRQYLDANGLDWKTMVGIAHDAV